MKFYTFNYPCHHFCLDSENSFECGGSSAAGFCLKLPGKNLYLTPLLKAKKFRSYGYKTGAMSAFRELQTADLGTVEEFGAGKGGRTVRFLKVRCILQILFLIAI